MIPAWLALVLDRMLPDLTGGQRDEIARAVVAAIPLSVLEQAIHRAASPVLADHTDIIFGRDDLARAIATAAAPRIATALLEAP